MAARNKAIKLDAIPQLPSGLIEAVTNRRVVLFLGAGASMESHGPKGEKPPSANDLRDRLNHEFLGGKVGNADLMSVADMAIENAGQSVVFERIRSMLAPLVPTPAHKLLPTMRWRALVTTNYDELVEKGYQSVPGRLQNVVPIVKNTEPVEELLQNTERPVVLLKLHGCINHAHDEQVPLVLSHEHYALHDRHRSNLYARLSQLAHESTFVFCGYGIGDAHIRNILHRLEADGIKRPTYYIVTPVMEEVQAEYWAKKKVTLIKATFGLFMAAIDSRLPEMWRSLDAGQGLKELSVRRHFRTNRDASPALTAALDRDLRHVHASMSAEPQNARRFYEGFDTGWGAILQDLDIHRRVMNDLLSKAIIEEESETEPRLILLRGPAGSGKSVALKRSAMVAAEQFDSLALWLQPDGALRAEGILELADLSGKRIYVFIDRAAVHVARIESLLRAAKQKNAPITIIAAERDSEWNAFAPRIAERWKPYDFRLGNLAPREVEDLVTILGTHNSLGLLSTYPRDKQVEAFMKRADRQLLVALHEATRGKPFEDIVFDEYQGIASDRARHLYLDICTLNQFAVPVRAGTISRVAGIRFDDYRRNLFEPLENVVLTNENRYTGDIEYRARHPKVAEFVFQAACPTDEAKGMQLTRMIEHLDVGFEPDRVAVESIAKGRSLSDIFSSASAGRDIYSALVTVLPDAAFLYQQWAIFEYTVQGGSLEEAERLATQARAIDPRLKSAAHTHAEVARRRASAEKSPLLKEQYRRLARQRLNDAGAANDMLVLSSRCKLLVDDVKDLVEAAGGVYDDEAEKALSDLVREAEREIQKAQQLYHEFADLDETQWRLNVILDEHRKAQRALERAWKKNPRGTSVAIRLAKDYLSHDENEKARLILEEALQRFPDDRDVHVAMARFLLRREGDLTDQIGDHLARSYRPGDANYDARHLHAQFLFCRGDVKGAQNLFDDVKQRAPGEFRSRSHKPSGDIGRHIPKGVGRIVSKDSTFCFIRSPGYARDVYANEANSDVAVWEGLQSGAQVEFQFAFSREGPVAYGLRPLSG